MLLRIKKIFTESPIWGVIIGTLFLYFPSLQIPFRDPDQMVYFANTQSWRSLWELLSHLDYSVDRIYWKGDDLLYRPLLFALLALENFFFSYHYILWNILNLGLHLAVLWAFYRLLNAIWPERWFASLFCGLFAFSNAPMGLVVNPHLGGYLCGFFCFLSATRIFYSLLKETNIAIRDISSYAFWALGSVLCYELTIPFVLLAGLFFTIQKKSELNFKKILIFNSPLLLYGLFFTLHALRVERLFYASSVDAASVLSFENFRTWPQNTEYLFRQFFRDVFPDQRLYKVFLIGSFLAVFCKGLFTGPIRWLIRFYPAFLLLIYTFGLAFYRATFARDYYPYLFHLLLALCFYSQINFSKLSQWNQKIAYFYLIALIACNAAASWKIQRGLPEPYKSSAAYFSSLNAFVDEHRNDPNFSFKILKPYPESDIPIELKIGYPDGYEKTFLKNTSEILYDRYIDFIHPKYSLKWDAKKLIFEEGA